MTDNDKKLLNDYENRLKVADRVHVEKFDEHLTENEKLMTAKCLKNTQVFIQEACSTEIKGASEIDDELQGSKDFKWDKSGEQSKFAMNMVNMVMPNLIAPYVALPYAMSSLSGSGYVQSIDHTPLYGDYTPVKVEETYGVARMSEFVLSYTPIIKGSIEVETPNDTFYDDGEGNMIYAISGVRIIRKLELAKNNENGLFKTEDVEVSAFEEFEDGSTQEIDIKKCICGSVDYNTGKVCLYADVLNTPQNESGADGIKIVYFYKSTKNLKVPYHMTSIPLVAKAKRLKINFKDEEIEKELDDKIANGEIEEKDRELKRGGLLASNAVEDARNEIDTAVLSTIIKNAVVDEKLVKTITENKKWEWNETANTKLSKQIKYEGFGEAIDEGIQILYDRTKKFMPTYMLISESLLPMLESEGMDIKSSPYKKGPYVCGEFMKMTVIVAPNMPEDEFILGVNDAKHTYSAVVYAPYLPIVPAQLVGFVREEGEPDGFATLYDLQVLDKTAIIAGKITIDNTVNIITV